MKIFDDTDGKPNEFINPFKTGKFINPAVTLEYSRKRCTDKLKALDGKFTKE